MPTILHMPFWATCCSVVASMELLEMAEGLRAADRDMTEALRVAKQAMGDFLEKNEDVIALGSYMGQCVQTMEWQFLQSEAD